MSVYTARVESDGHGEVIQLRRDRALLDNLTPAQCLDLAHELEDCARHLLATSTGDLLASLEAQRDGGRP